MTQRATPESYFQLQEADDRFYWFLAFLAFLALVAFLAIVFRERR